jgi:RNA polymerase sigma-70 factor (ECF subfamily)
MVAGSGGLTDAQLVQRVALGDEPALEELYDRHASAVFRLAFRLVGDRQLAEEVLQETYLALWNRAELFDPAAGSLTAWLLTIARNRSVDRLRAAGRRPVQVPMSAAVGQDERDDGVEWTLATGSLLGAAPAATDPQEALDQTWLKDAVRQALDGVPDLERRAIELAYYEELTQTEIAQRLGWPLGTVKTRTRRALSRLRSVLAEALGPELGRRVAPVPVVDTASRPHALGERGSDVAQEAARGRDGPR